MTGPEESQSRPPPPEARPCINFEWCGSLTRSFWNRNAKGLEHWSRRRYCHKCRDLWQRHRFTPEDYDKFFADGCSIPGCKRPATDIDHDHFICPKINHSCEKCRRGPLCRPHNNRIITVLDQMRAGRLEAE